MISQFMGRPAEYWLKIEAELAELKSKNNTVHITSDLKPSNELRFVLRGAYSIERGDFCQRILQQKWYEDRHPDINYVEPPSYIWVDVPVESEK